MRKLGMMRGISACSHWCEFAARQTSDHRFSFAPAMRSGFAFVVSPSDVYTFEHGIWLGSRADIGGVEMDSSPAISRSIFRLRFRREITM